MHDNAALRGAIILGGHKANRTTRADTLMLSSEVNGPLPHCLTLL
jgi:hypothetical protein